MYTLHTEMLELVKEERRLTGVVIEKLQQINAEKIYLKMGYGNIYEYCIKALGYSESAAHRRISASRIAQEIPEVREKLDQGTLSLTNLAMAQTAFRKAQTPPEVKRQVISELENKSKHQAEAILSEVTGIDLKPKEQIRAISQEEVRMQLTIPKELLHKLDKIKALRSHKNPKQDYISLLTDMSDYILKKIDPTTRTSVKKDTEEDLQSKDQSTVQTEVLTKLQPDSQTAKPIATPGHTSKNPVKNTRYIRAFTKRKVYLRDQGHCTYVDPMTKKRCQSQHFLQMDHIIEYSAGGGAEPNNLRLLCHAHHKKRHLGGVFN